MLLRIGSGEQRDVLEHAAEIHFHQMKFASPHEVNESLHHAVEPMNLAADDIHVTAGIRVELRELVLQELQVEHDGVDGILHFMSNAAGHASAGREAAGHLNFVADAAHGFGVAHNQQRADLGAFLLNKIQRHLHAPAGGRDKLALRERSPAFKSVEHRGAERRVPGKNFRDGSAQQFSSRPAEKALHRRAHQHDAGVSREQHQAVLQLRHELVHVVFQSGKNFPAVAHLPAKVGDLQSDQAEFVVFRFCPRTVPRLPPN